ncbi:intermembrane phospholipid transport protein YdbH family protein [Paraglaciecola arctica]|uniref:Uncharacterized protein n=1 Tax=Paraglaciecola arctica BSs20135 TaxID=493475 RepID=K6YB37_9ALTE|nr:YdbH domain-containing protein [Paraglaciecola arctica]GAC21171.1 hypothetical protein GARC_4229 [Paraglaciecola arctica BSs20135]
MTALFWQKRPSKKLIAILLFVIILITAFVFRRPIAIKSIEYLAQSQNLHVNCLDFSLDWQLNLNVKQACVTFPAGEILVQKAIWQPWSNILSIELLKVKHLTTDNSVDNEPKKENQTTSLNLPTSLPKLRISSIEIDSFELLQPLHLSVNTTSSNEWSISGDLNASVKMQQNTLVGNLVWSLSDLTNWIPQAQNLSQDNTELLAELASDESKITTLLTFDGNLLSAASSLDIASRFDVSSCPIDTVFKGNVLVGVDISSLNISLDLSQLSNNVSLLNCSLIQDYFATDDLPKLSFVFPQKVTLNRSQINLPKLQIVDTQNPLRSILLDGLNYKTTGELAVNYNISLKQPIKTKQIQAGMLDIQAQGRVSADVSALNTPQPMSWEISDANNRLVVNHLQMDRLFIGSLTTEFTLQHSGTKPLKMQGTIDSSEIQTGDIKLAKTSHTFGISGASLNDLQLSIDNQILQLDHPDANVGNISNHMDLNIQELATLSFSGHSTVTNIRAQNIKLQPITVAHLGQANVPNNTISSQHKISLEQGFLIELEQQKTKAKLLIDQQDMLALTNIMSQLENDLIIEQGNLSASIEFSLPQADQSFIALGKADFQGVSAKYQDYVLNNITYQTPLTFDSAGLQLSESTLHIDSIDVGVPISQLKANVIAKDSVLRLKQVQGEIFNGSFSTSQLWLDGRNQQVSINFQNIDLAQVVALQQQPGIKITGNINGDLPLIINKQGISIEEGWASSLSGGKLTIVDNPSFDSIKAQQPELALLENLDFTQLKSNVKFTPDGWIFFDFSLIGNNPVKKQGVNFNYSHQENIFSLLESIRLVKSVENKIEQKITQGEKK